MRLMCASSAEGTGTCDADGCGGWTEREELVYICTAHNKYACRECVPRAMRLTVDALLDECVMVEQEIEQFSQELGLWMVDVPTAVCRQRRSDSGKAGTRAQTSGDAASDC